MGVISLPQSMEQDRLNQIKANSVHVDDNFNTLLTAVNRKLEIDGSIVPTADLPMGSHKITGLATPTASGDAATKGYVDSVVLPCVKTTGDQTIAGTKTFSSTINGSISGSSASCTGNAATVTNGVYTTGNQTIGGTKTFSAAAYGQASSAANSILTTVASSKGSNGYFKLGNGMIIQWGSIGNTGTTVVNLPTAFSNTNYAILLTGITGMYMWARNNESKSTTSFRTDYASTVSPSVHPYYWLAIGY